MEYSIESPQNSLSSPKPTLEDSHIEDQDFNMSFWESFQIQTIADSLGRLGIYLSII